MKNAATLFLLALGACNSASEGAPPPDPADGPGPTSSASDAGTDAQGANDAAADADPADAPVVGHATASFESQNLQFMVAEGGGGGTVNANRDLAGAWETFQL